MTYRISRRPGRLAAALLCPGMLLAGAASAAPLSKILYTFKGGADGAQPVGDLVAVGTGTLIGLTQGGGPNSQGEVFSLTPPTGTGKPWTKTLIYAFTGGADGGTPKHGLVADAKGNLYGTTVVGGANGLGTLFELSPGKSGYTQTVLYNLGVSQYGGVSGPLTFDAAGNLYGVSFQGGSSFAGGVFQFSPPAKGGTGWTETDIHDFTGVDGELPLERVTFDAAGNLYGTTVLGGPGKYGNVYTLHTAKQKWKFTALLDFAAGSTGASPQAGVAFAKDGTMVGTTPVTANANGLSKATIFSGKQVKGVWSFSVIGTLDPNVCGLPAATLLAGANNNFYGTGSQPSCAFKVQLRPATAITQVIGLPPAFARGGLTSDGKGNLFGATQQGQYGIGFGTIYQLTGTFP
jgi:uncharacterized repeat protein (TIGR03803 family)